MMWHLKPWKGKSIIFATKHLMVWKFEANIWIRKCQFKIKNENCASSSFSGGFWPKYFYFSNIFFFVLFSLLSFFISLNAIGLKFILRSSRLHQFEFFFILKRFIQRTQRTNSNGEGGGGERGKYGRMLNSDLCIFIYFFQFNPRNCNKSLLNLQSGKISE